MRRGAKKKRGKKIKIQEIVEEKRVSVKQEILY